MADYSNRDMTQGALFINNRKKAANQPDFRGELTLSKALLKELVERVKEGKEPKLSLSVWKKKSKAGNEYQSIAAQIHTEYKKDGGSDEIEVPF
jgi:hypothetical protein